MERILFGSFTVADAVVCLVFLVFAIWKGRRGFYDSFMPLVVALVAFIGALILTRVFAAAATEWVWPWVQQRFAERVDLSSIRVLDLGQITSSLESLLPASVLNVSDKLGLELSGFVSTAMQSASDGARQVADSAAAALLRTVTESAVRVLLFLVCWGVLSLLLTLIKNAAGLVFRLPVIRGIDAMGGAVLGLLLCFVLLYVLMWLACLLNVEPILDFARHSTILQWIMHL